MAAEMGKEKLWGPAELLPTKRDRAGCAVPWRRQWAVSLGELQPPGEDRNQAESCLESKSDCLADTVPGETSVAWGPGQKQGRCSKILNAQLHILHLLCLHGSG